MFLAEVVYPENVHRQRATAGSKLSQAEATWLAKVMPRRHSPDTDHFAKHLADFGGRDKVALGAKYIAVHVVARQGVCKHLAHVRCH